MRITSTLSYCFRVWFLSAVLVVSYFTIAAALGFSDRYSVLGTIILCSISMPFVFLMNFLVGQIVKLTNSQTNQKLILSALHVAAVATVIVVVEYAFTRKVKFGFNDIVLVLPYLITGWIGIWVIALRPTEKYTIEEDIDIML